MAEVAAPSTTQEADAALDAIEDTEAPDETAPAPVETEGDEASPPASDALRNADGTFATREADAPEGDEPPATPPDEPTEPPPDAAEVDLTQFETFRYRATGQDREFPGAVVGNAGDVLFTPETVPLLKQKLALAENYPQLQSQHARDTHQRQATIQALEAQLAQVSDKMEELITNPGAFEQFIEDRRKNWDVFKAQLQVTALERKQAAGDTELQQYRQQQEDARLWPIMQESVGAAVQQYGTVAGLDHAAQQRLYTKLLQNPDMLFPRATHDDPVSGVKAGTRLDGKYQQIVQDEVAYLAQILGPRPTKPKVQEKVAAAAKTNAQLKGKAAPKAPTVPGTGPAPKQTSKIPTFKTTAEMDEWLWENDGIAQL